MSDGSPLAFTWSPKLVEGAESDGETMLDCIGDAVAGMEYEYPDPEEDIVSYGACDSGNASNDEECSDRECLIYPSKRKQRRAKLCGLHCYVARTSAVAVAASAASASIMVEGVASGDSTSSPSNAAASLAILACVVSGIVALLSDLFSRLAKTIGSHPQLRLRHEDGFLGRAWWKNLCGCFCFASLVIMISNAFLTDLVSQISNTVSDVWLFADASTDRFLFRAFTVIVLSLISGCFLGMKNPVLSALLCGL